MTNTTKTRAQAGNEIFSYVVYGVLLLIVGGLAAAWGISNLTSEPAFMTDETQTNGAAVAALVGGWLATAAGSFSVLVGVIAKGVQVGNRATGLWGCRS